MSPLDSKHLTQFLKKIGPSIVRFAQSKAPMNSAQVYEESKEDPEQPTLRKTQSNELEQKLGFTATYQFSYSSDEESDEDDEAMIETSQANLIKNLKSDTFDQAGPPIFNPRNQGPGSLFGVPNQGIVIRVNPNGGLFNS